MDQALDDLREEIESIDCGLLRLWEKRMYTAVKVGVYKRDHDIAVFDPEREKQLWFNWQQQLDEDNADLAALIFHANTAAARLRQGQICRTRQPNIYLAGLQDSGVIAAGQEAARRLGRGFCDTEQALAAMYGCPVSQMLEQGGEELAGARETALLSALAAQPAGLIVAARAEAALSPLNVSLMRASGAIIMVQLTSAGPSVSPLDKETAGLWQQRESFIRSAAAAEVCGSSADELAAQIVELLE